VKPAVSPVRARLIVNPFASAVTEEGLRSVERALTPAFELETVLTERRGHATELARDAAGDAILVFGGDGVANEVLNGVDGSRPLGFLPGGGTNVLPRALGLPRDPVAAAVRLTELRERRISLGRVNGRRFAFAAGIGLDSAAVRRVDALGRREDGRRPGDLAFVRAVVSVVRTSGWRLPECLEVAGRPASLVAVANDAVYTYAGALPLRFCPAARFELGLDYAAVEGPGALAVAAGLVRAAAGKSLAGLRGGFGGHDLDRLEVRCRSACPLQADGEDLGDVTGAVFEAERDAVTVLA
jgi:diacylglycerol kinase family enzyme